MTYHLGVDIGTTFTAAAVARDGRAEAVTLGASSVAVPSVVCFSGDEVVVGHPAQRRALTHASQVAREFKRRVGDPTPVSVGDRLLSPESLMARLFDHVVSHVAATEGEAPASLVVTHPASWGDHKRGLLRQAIEDVGVEGLTLVAEPVAAATFYASQRRLDPGVVVAVYDLGGGTFDAAAVRAEADGFVVLGHPEGIERLGGVDFDQAVFRHVAEVAGIDLDALDPDADVTMRMALAQVRQECTAAKEALSSETHVSIPVMLPDGYREVRLTRAEFEALIAPAIDETLATLERAIGSTGLTPADIDSVLLVGGSSRIPLVGQLVAAELRLPIAVDARPKDAIPMGAALAGWHASSAADTGPPPASQPDRTSEVSPTAPTPPSEVGMAVPSPQRTGRTALAVLAAAVLVVLGVTLWETIGAAGTEGGPTLLDVPEPGGDVVNRRPGRSEPDRHVGPVPCNIFSPAVLDRLGGDVVPAEGPRLNHPDGHDSLRCELDGVEVTTYTFEPSVDGDGTWAVWEAFDVQLAHDDAVAGLGDGAAFHQRNCQLVVADSNLAVRLSGTGSEDSCDGRRLILLADDFLAELSSRPES